MKRLIVFVGFMFLSSFLFAQSDSIKLDTVYLITATDTIPLIGDIPNLDGLQNVAIDLDKVVNTGKVIGETVKESGAKTPFDIFKLLTELLLSGVLVSFITQSIKAFNAVKDFVGKIKSKYLVISVGIILAAVYEFSQNGIDGFSFSGLAMKASVATAFAVMVFEFGMKNFSFFKKKDEIQTDA